MDNNIDGDLVELGSPRDSIPVSIVILTFNSERNILKTIQSSLLISDDVHVLDSGSTDSTLELLKNHRVNVQFRPFKSYGDQRNWAISNLPLKHDWQLHLDSDEYISTALHKELISLFKGLDGTISGFYIPRLIKFHGREIRHGGMWPIYHMRLFKAGFGVCEMRGYDQHFCLKGKAGTLKSPMVDDIKLSLSEWTARHNRWSDAEVLEVLNPAIYELNTPGLFGPIARKRFLRAVFNKTPYFWRSFGIFIYRYIFRFGFLDGRWGLIFFMLQTFWFRFLVDSKLYESEQHEN